MRLVTMLAEKTRVPIKILWLLMLTTNGKPDGPSVDGGNATAYDHDGQSSSAGIVTNQVTARDNSEVGGNVDNPNGETNLRIPPSSPQAQPQSQLSHGPIGSVFDPASSSSPQ